jgi:hypothetical protein
MGMKRGDAAMKSWWPLAALSLSLLACSADPGSDQNGSSPKVSAANVIEDECDPINQQAERESAAVEANPNLSEAEREIALTRIAAATGQCGMRPVPPGTPDPPDISAELAAIYVDAVDAARRFGHQDGACRAAIGSRRANALEAICSQVSGATHPPCNAANSCDYLVEEIDRNCLEDMKSRWPRLCAAARTRDRAR